MGTRTSSHANPRLLPSPSQSATTDIKFHRAVAKPHTSQHRSSIATVRFHAIRVRMNHRTGSATCFSPCVLRRPMHGTHGRAGAVNTQQPSCQAEKGLSVSPWHPSAASTPRPRPFPPLAFTDEKVNKMVERIKVT